MQLAALPPPIPTKNIPITYVNVIIGMQIIQLQLLHHMPMVCLNVRRFAGIGVRLDLCSGNRIMGVNVSLIPAVPQGLHTVGSTTLDRTRLPLIMLLR